VQQPNDPRRERSLKLEFAVVLAFVLLAYAGMARFGWDLLTAWF
jgi:hypothetical protein